MGISLGSPVMQGLKSFWQRPEGTVGKIALVIACLAAGYGFVQLLPWLIAAATDTLHLVLLIGGILVGLFTGYYRGIADSSSRAPCAT